MKQRLLEYIRADAIPEPDRSGSALMLLLSAFFLLLSLLGEQEQEYTILFMGAGVGIGLGAIGVASAGRRSADHHEYEKKRDAEFMQVLIEIRDGLKD